MTTTATLTQIDPPTCACTECLTGQHVPLDQATLAQLDAMIAGKLSDATAVSERDFDRHLDYLEGRRRTSPIVNDYAKR